MARDLSCASGKKAYKTKRECEDANPGMEAKRCHRCRWHHAHPARARKASQKKPGTGRGR